ncbi:hypothetical protein [Candidatus Electrothrix sp.]|uniref:hypothetical protein n=1 Tax=Candidatus Electrothrix sp. TaxID=2170559 RepID=UPI00405699C8
MTNVKALWLIIVIGLVVTTVQAEQFKSFDIVSADTVSVKVVFSRNYPVLLEVVLGQPKARELEELTKTSIDHKIVITINGKVVAEPIVREAVSSGIIRIPANDEATAIRLAKSLTTEDR